MEPMMTRTRINNGGGGRHDDGGGGSPDQIWARARMMAANPDLGTTYRQERRELVGRRRQRERCACVELVLEAMRSDSGTVALGEEREMMEGENRGGGI
jgi:hypothetical protein